MGDFFLLQMDDFFTEGLCFETSKEGKGERRIGAPPFCEVPRRGSLAASGRGRSKVGAKQTRKLRPYERSRCAEHGGSCEEVATHHVRGFATDRPGAPAGGAAHPPYL